MSPGGRRLPSDIEGCLRTPRAAVATLPRGRIGEHFIFRLTALDVAPLALVLRKRALSRAACETDDERRLWTTAQSRAGDFGWLWSISHPFPHAKSPSPSRPPRDIPSDRRIATKNGAMIPCRPSRCSSAKAKATDRPPACSAELWRAFGLEGRPTRRTRARRTPGAENPGPKDARRGAPGLEGRPVRSARVRRVLACGESQRRRRSALRAKDGRLPVGTRGSRFDGIRCGPGPHSAIICIFSPNQLSFLH